MERRHFMKALAISPTALLLKPPKTKAVSKDKVTIHIFGLGESLLYCGRNSDIEVFKYDRYLSETDFGFGLLLKNYPNLLNYEKRSQAKFCPECVQSYMQRDIKEEKVIEIW